MLSAPLLSADGGSRAWTATSVPTSVDEMGRPLIQDHYGDRFGTLHSITVRPLESGRFAALARLCILTDDGDWKWVNRRSSGDSAEAARSAIMDRVINVLGCRSQEETNRLTGGLHRGHRKVADPSALHSGINKPNE